MEPGRFKSFLVSLPELTKEQREVLLSRLRVRAKVTEEAPDEADWLFHGLRQFLFKRGLRKTLNMRNIKTNPAYHIYLVNAPGVRATLEAAVGKPMTKVQRQALGLLSMELLAAHIEKWGVISGDSLMRHVDRVPEAVERGFPGYIRAGLLALVVAKR